MTKNINLTNDHDNGFKNQKHHCKHNTMEERAACGRKHIMTRSKLRLKKHFGEHFWPKGNENKRGHKI